MYSSYCTVYCTRYCTRYKFIVLPRSVALASRSHVDQPFNIAIGPLGIWSYSVLETWNSPSTTQENVCETQGLHGGDRIPQSQVSRTEKDSGLVGSTIYYDFEEY